MINDDFEITYQIDYIRLNVLFILTKKNMLKTHIYTLHMHYFMFLHMAH